MQSDGIRDLLRRENEFRFIVQTRHEETQTAGILGNRGIDNRFRVNAELQQLFGDRQRLTRGGGRRQFPGDIV